MKALASKLSVKLIFKDLKLVTVESCTGGLIGQCITDLSGSSDWYEGGLITYSNEAKARWANVSLELIEKYGAVSAQVAEAMAVGAGLHFPKGVSVAVTGIAGPSGGSAEKPIGTVHIASHYLNETKTRKYNFQGSRRNIREESAKAAMNLVLSMQLVKN